MQEYMKFDFKDINDEDLLNHFKNFYLSVQESRTTVRENLNKGADDSG